MNKAHAKVAKQYLIKTHYRIIFTTFFLAFNSINCVFLLQLFAFVFVWWSCKCECSGSCVCVIVSSSLLNIISTRCIFFSLALFIFYDWRNI